MTEIIKYNETNLSQFGDDSLIVPQVPRQRLVRRHDPDLEDVSEGRELGQQHVYLGEVVVDSDEQQRRVLLRRHENRGPLVGSSSGRGLERGHVQVLHAHLGRVGADLEVLGSSEGGEELVEVLHHPLDDVHLREELDADVTVAVRGDLALEEHVLVEELRSEDRLGCGDDRLEVFFGVNSGGFAAGGQRRRAAGRGCEGQGGDRSGAAHFGLGRRAEAAEGTRTTQPVDEGLLCGGRGRQDWSDLRVDLMEVRGAVQARNGHQTAGRCRQLRGEGVVGGKVMVIRGVVVSGGDRVVHGRNVEAAGRLESRNFRLKKIGILLLRIKAVSTRMAVVEEFRYFLRAALLFRRQLLAVLTVDLLLFILLLRSEIVFFCCRLVTFDRSIRFDFAFIH